MSNVILDVLASAVNSSLITKFYNRVHATSPFLVNFKTSILLCNYNSSSALTISYLLRLIHKQQVIPLLRNYLNLFFEVYLGVYNIYTDNELGLQYTDCFNQVI